MTRTILFSMTLLALSLPCLRANALDRDSQYLIMGPGSYGCNRVISDLTRDAQAKDPSSVILYSTWLAGSLTSYNRDSKNTYSILGDTTFDEVFAWTIQFCSDNPGAIYAASVDALTTKLTPHRSILMPKTQAKHEEDDRKPNRSTPMPKPRDTYEDEDENTTRFKPQHAIPMPKPSDTYEDEDDSGDRLKPHRGLPVPKLRDTYEDENDSTDRFKSQRDIPAPKPRDSYDEDEDSSTERFKSHFSKPVPKPHDSYEEDKDSNAERLKPHPTMQVPRDTYDDDDSPPRSKPRGVTGIPRPVQKPEWQEQDENENDDRRSEE